jgi:transcription-repair coupling factor (superfamily II helicase)
MTPQDQKISGDAQKRLDALSSLDHLGAGFTLATHDLEIRGAGELLGDEQSGHIQEIGFSLYTEFLERAVAAIREGRELDLEHTEDNNTEIDLRIPALIPEDYLPDVHERLVLYKRISAAPSSRNLDELQVEMIDRFGLLPPTIKNLFTLMEIKLQARSMGIRKIDAGPKGGFLLMHSAPNLNVQKIIELIQKQPHRFKLEGGEKLKFSRPLEEIETRLNYVTGLLSELALSTPQILDS